MDFGQSTTGIVMLYVKSILIQHSNNPGQDRGLWMEFVQHQHGALPIRIEMTIFFLV